MSYLVLLKFGSTQAADFFVTRPLNQPYQPTNATVPSGYTEPIPGIGSPGSSPTTSTWVTVQVPSPDIFLPGNQLYGYQPQFIFDNSTRTVIQNSSNIDPNSLTIMQGDNTVIQNGLPSPDYIPPSTDQVTPVTPYSSLPFDFPQVREDPDLRKIMERIQQYQQQQQELQQLLQEQQQTTPQLIADYPQDPNVMRDPFNPLDPRNLVPPEQFERPAPTPEDVQRLPGYDPMAPYDDSPLLPPADQIPLQFFPDKMEIPESPPWVDPYIYKERPRPSDPLKVKPISDSGEGGGVPLAVGPTWFGVAGFGSSLLTQQVTIFRSIGGFNWVGTDLTGFINFVANASLPPVSFLQFRNGFGMMVGTSSIASSVVYRALSSADQGRTWQLVIGTSPGDGKSITTPTFANNQWTIPVVNGTNVIVPVPWAVGTYPLNSIDGDNVGFIPNGGVRQVAVSNSGDGKTNNLQVSIDSGNTFITTLTVTSAAGMQPWALVYQEFNPTLSI